MLIVSSFWGSDVTNAVCEKNHLSLIIRSHECQIDGYAYTHNNKVTTHLCPAP
jgi:hypothetical protein